MPASLRSLAAVLAFSLGACLPPPLADCGDVSCGDPPLTTGGVASEPTTGPGGDFVAASGARVNAPSELVIGKQAELLMAEPALGSIRAIAGVGRIALPPPVALVSL